MSKTLNMQKRLEGISRFYETIDSFIDNFPVQLPSAAKDLIFNAIKGDSELDEMIDSINKRRAPKFVLFGRTGVGKSSLINAIAGQYLAEIHDVKSCTTKSEVIRLCKKQGEPPVFEVMDTRGIGESDPLSYISAEDQLLNDIHTFHPDAVLFLVRAKGRDYLQEDLKVLKKIQNQNSLIPVIVLVTQCDELQPNDELHPKEYSGKKIKNINEAVNQIKTLVENEYIQAVTVMPVSFNIKWNIDVTSDDYTDDEKKNARIVKNYALNINPLINVLENSIDLKAWISLMLVINLDAAIRKVSGRFIKAFSQASAVVASTPIPLSDIAILLPIQALEIMVIAALSGEKLDIEMAKKLIVSFGGATAAGFSFRKLAQQGSKFLNLVFNGSGSLISSWIAYSGTKAIGKAAEKYFFDSISDEQELHQTIKAEIQNGQD